MNKKYERFLDKNGNPSSMRLSHEIDSLRLLTPWLNKDAPMAEVLYHLLHDLKEYPKRCQKCDKPVAFAAWGAPYKGSFCSKSCFYDYRRENLKVKEKVKKPLLTKEERLARQKKTNQERYGKDWAWMTEESKEKRKKKARLIIAENWIQESEDEACFAPEEYENSRQRLNFKCKTCDTIFSIQRYRSQNDSIQKCPTCFTANASAPQHELAKWLREIGETVKLNDRSLLKGKFEIDLFLQDKNVGIEYDGLFWHSEKARPDIREKCKEKHEALLKANVKMIYVYEHEWLKKKALVKGRILAKLNKGERLFARKCEIKIPTKSDERKFFDENHLQGFVGSKIALGLYFNDELVACMSFGRPRFGNQHSCELLRFANKNGTVVVGGASKLFSAWLKMHPNMSVISFSNNRWGDGGFYEKLGFVNDGQTGQGYFYFGPGNQIASRQEMQKHKLETKLKTFDKTLTERDNCFNNGWYRVWDLGNTRWTFNQHK